ncbi:MAG: hypothetical protein ACJ0F8_00030 [Gammaproteobacteria bacterium]|jgi:hypothetical protein|tara:strand:+ start:185 stop:331 length:147 start_codon:yes stop_codon:yes gene_type:complete
MNKKLMVFQSFMWAAAMLVVALVEEKQFIVLLLVLLATVSLINLKKVN